MILGFFDLFLSINSVHIKGVLKSDCLYLFSFVMFKFFSNLAIWVFHCFQICFKIFVISFVIVLIITFNFYLSAFNLAPIWYTSNLGIRNLIVSVIEKFNHRYYYYHCYYCHYIVIVVIIIKIIKVIIIYRIIIIIRIIIKNNVEFFVLLFKRFHF